MSESNHAKFMRHRVYYDIRDSTNCHTVIWNLETKHIDCLAILYSLAAEC